VRQRSLRKSQLTEDRSPLSSQKLVEDAEQMESIAIGFKDRLHKLHDQAPGDQRLPDVAVAATAWDDADLEAEGETLQLASNTAVKVIHNLNNMPYFVVSCDTRSRQPFTFVCRP
jgi:hypothetical protein